MATGYTRQFRFITLVIILTASFRNSYADQDKERITINAKGISIESAFRKIEAQVSVTFFYLVKDLNGRELIPNLSLNNVTINEAISTILKGKNLSWSIKNDVIYIKSKTPEAIDSQAKSESDTLPKYTISGRVTDRSGLPLPGVTVSLKGQLRGQGTNSEGQFQIANVTHNTTITFSSIGFETKQIRITGPEAIRVVLDTSIREIKAVEVVYTGYQAIARQKTTGSYELVDNKMLNRRVSTNITERLEGIVAGLAFNKNTQLRANESSMTIRSRGTILANPNPLIIVDNFPYQGDINSINPNDVESITILKDAAASSIWGAYSGNGVIVITTKSGRNFQSLKVSFNSNVTMGGRPNLYDLPRLSSSDYIGYEKFLFENKYYLGSENSSSRPFLSPVVEILIKQRDGVISNSEAENQLAHLEGQNVVDQQRKFLYRPNVNQQYSLNLSGGGKNQSYYISFGYDRNADNIVENSNDRVSLNAKNSLNLLSNKLEINFGVYYSKRNVRLNGIDNVNSPLPYLNLGTRKEPGIIGRGYRDTFIDTAGAGKLLDWHFYPLAEVGLNDNITTSTDYRFDADVKYKLTKFLDLSVMYQYANGISDNNRLLHESSFFTRDLINQYSQINYSTGQITRAIPIGGIMDRVNMKYQSYNIRSQISFKKVINLVHEVAALAGVEQREVETNRVSKRLYGYNDELGTETLVDLFKDFPTFNSVSVRKIPNPYTQPINITNNRFRSYFANVIYRYDDKYSLTASIRRDESNIFGVKTNQKGIPLWSVGTAWDISNEKFYEAKWIPYLKVRASFGYNGNMDNSLSAYTTATVGAQNQYNSPTLIIRNPPNPKLRWEKTETLNIGLDFRLANNNISGSIEYYTKNGMDLISSSLIDPTTGIGTFTGNTANIKGRGFDITLNSNILNRKFKWSNTFIISHAVDRISSYNLPFGILNTLFFNTAISPVEGNPLYSVYAYRWAGLDPSNGDPTAYLEGKATKDYVSLYTSTDIRNVKFIGSAKPTYFGSFMNTFEWNKLSLSFNITYKLDYFFRKISLQYSTILNNANSIQKEYNSRWQKPGDERITNVPSRIYPSNSLRDLMYANSDINVMKGDHIRLQDVRVEYPIKVKIGATESNISIYGYINNVGVIWKANKEGLDPDFIGGIRTPRSYSLGVNIGL